MTDWQGAHVRTLLARCTSAAEAIRLSVYPAPWGAVAVDFRFSVTANCACFGRCATCSCWWMEEKTQDWKIWEWHSLAQYLPARKKGYFGNKTMMSFYVTAIWLLIIVALTSVISTQMCHYILTVKIVSHCEYPISRCAWASGRKKRTTEDYRSLVRRVICPKWSRADSEIWR